MYLDFVIDLVNLLVYMSFFFTLFHYYGLPIHLIRQLYFSFVSFQKRLLQITRYHTATRDLDRRFPLAPPSRLSGERADDCIVCREPMESGRVLPCGHIMHSRCLLSWLELSQTCPICRVSVITELNAPQPGQNPVRPPIVPGNPPEWNNAPPFNFQPYQHIPVNNNIGGLPQPGLQPVEPPNELRETVPPVDPHIPFTLPVQSSSEPVPQPSDLSRIEAHVELMQEQLAILQEQFSVLLSDLRTYKRQNGVRIPGNPDNNKDESKLEPETESGSPPKTISSPPPSELSTEEKPTPSTPPEVVDPEREEVRKRRLLRFSSEHTLTRPDN